jgi:hypothetical protein
VPIIERKPEQAFKRFHQHINRLVTATVTLPAHVRLAWTSRGDLGFLEFVRGDGIGTAVPLITRFGTLYWTLYQVLETEAELTKYRLKTKEYSYRLLDLDDPRADSIIRWEYVSDAPPTGYCRHHVQVTTGVRLGGSIFDMNRAHTPSGWVTIEEILRFIIVDLGVLPRTKNWPSVLAASERKFYEDFTSKRYKPQHLRILPGGRS